MAKYLGESVFSNFQPVVIHSTTDSLLDGKYAVVIGRFGEDHYIVELEQHYDGFSAIVLTQHCIRSLDNSSKISKIVS